MVPTIPLGARGGVGEQVVGEQVVEEQVDEQVDVLDDEQVDVQARTCATCAPCRAGGDAPPLPARLLLGGAHTGVLTLARGLEARWWCHWRRWGGVPPRGQRSGLHLIFEPQGYPPPVAQKCV